MPDEFFAERILARDIVSEELSEAEKTLVREYASEFATEDFDPVESVEQIRKVINIMQDDSILDAAEFDSKVQERIVQFNNQIEAAKKGQIIKNFLKNKESQQKNCLIL